MLKIHDLIQQRQSKADRLSILDSIIDITIFPSFKEFHLIFEKICFVKPCPDTRDNKKHLFRFDPSLILSGKLTQFVFLIQSVSSDSIRWISSLKTVTREGREAEVGDFENFK